jgi:hypothetical protein
MSNPLHAAVIVDGDAWGDAALSRIIEIRREAHHLTVVAGADERFIQTCELWGEHAWIEPDTGWGVRIRGADAMHFALADARDCRREMSDVVWGAVDAAVVSPTLGRNPRVVLSGPRFAEHLVWSGRASRVVYLCSPKRDEDRRRALGSVTNAHMIEVTPVAATPIAT